jgi:uncharacterized membrane protein (DUF485 family)
MTGKNLVTLKASEEYQNFIRTRARIVWPLTIVMLVVYYSYILLIAFAPEILATEIGGGPTTIGIITGLGVIFFTFIITGIYVYFANTRLDPLEHKLHEHIKK